jgi:excisionase family DNA binding protein
VCPTNQPLLRVTDIANWLRLSSKAVYRMAEEGRIPSVKISNRLRFDPDAICQWLDEQQQQAKLGPPSSRGHLLGAGPRRPSRARGELKL